MSTTYKERLIEGLTLNGWKRDWQDRSKYAAFIHPQIQGIKLFVGPSGALRKGRCASDSYSIGDPSRQTSIYLAFLFAPICIFIRQAKDNERVNEVNQVC